MTSPFYPYPPTTSPTVSTGASDPFGLGDLGNQWIYYGSSTHSEKGPTADLGTGKLKTFSNPKTVNVGDTGNNLLSQFVASSVQSPAQFAQAQELLYAAGLYGTTKPKPGVYTSADSDAFKKALKDYSAVMNVTDKTGAPTTFTGYLSALVGAYAKQGGPGGGGATRAPLTISYTDPAELHEALQSAAQSDLGRDIGPKELALFVKVFHGKEASAQRAAYNGASSATNPEATGESQDYVATNNAKEAGERSQATYLDSISQLLGVK